MNPIFFDTHAHLDFPEFAPDLAAVLERAHAAGIERIITIGTTLETSRLALELADRHGPVFAAVGCHPSYVASAPEPVQEVREELREMARHPKVVAIGEAGLDYSRLPADPGEAADVKRRQAMIFQQQLEVARAESLNVIVHQRDSFADTLEIMRPFAPGVATVFHCFVGTAAERDQVLALGSLVSFTGIVTFKNAATVRDTACSAPLGSFMLETDCPFLAPVPYRGKRSEPAYVADIARFLARERNCALEELSLATCQAARRFFPKMS